MSFARPSARLLLLAIVALLATSVAADPAGGSKGETALVRVTDLLQDGKAAGSTRIPIVLLFSLPGCPHCEVVRRSHLGPLSREVPLRALVREIDTQSDQPMTGFDGRPTTHAKFAKAAGVNLTPVVNFYTPNGERIGDGLVGALLEDFYAGYLETALLSASTRLLAMPNTKAARR
jgi:thioredoxin-related protein